MTTKIEVLALQPMQGATYASWRHAGRAGG